MTKNERARERRLKRRAEAPRISSDPTTEWARDIVDGRIVAGELTIAAAERHLKDLRDRRDLFWRPERADHALGFFPAVLTITAGAHAGRPFELLPWHRFVAGSLFGWRLSSGRMRFRHAWLETGKGQAKSPFMAAIGLYLMGWYGIPRAEVYAIGQDRNTANVLFKDAVAMCRAPIPPCDDASDTIEFRGDVVLRGEYDNCWKIEHPNSGSKFQSLANGEAISGPRPIAVLADEIHEFKSVTPIEIWKNAIAKMPGDAVMLLGTNTPATTQVVGTNYSEFYQKVVRGDHVDDEAFAFIARVDKKDQAEVFDNEKCWIKALPALGITFPVENIRGQVNTAKVLLSTAMSVKRLYFGIPLGSTDFWIAEEAWSSVQGEVNPKDLVDCPCWLSLDLSKKNDLTALTALWLKNGKKYAKTWYWTTQSGLADRQKADGAPYEMWVDEGHINAIPGAVIDKTYVAEHISNLCATYNVKFLAFDSAGMADFIAACDIVGFPVWKLDKNTDQGTGLKLVAHSQGLRRQFHDRQLTMPTSIEVLEDDILNHNIVVDSSPVTYMCASNAQLDSDGMGNRCFNKKRSRGRIDGIVTLAMAAGAANMDDTNHDLINMQGFLNSPVFA